MEIGKKYGVTLRVGLTKAEMFEAIRAKLAGDNAEEDAEDSDDAADNADTEFNPVGDNDDDTGEDDDTEDDAPTFDATEAVN